jgi:hypothetical protein
VKSKLAFAFFGIAGLVLCFTVFRPKTERPGPDEPEGRGTHALSIEPTAPASHPPISSFISTSAPVEAVLRPVPVEKASEPDKLQRLTHIREQFRMLAAGAPQAAMDAGKELTDATERETALLTLVTEWTHGDLRRPEERAQAIAQNGLEAGLGMELTKNHDLAVLWANELTQGSGRAALLGQIAAGMVRSEPAAAFALSDSVAPGEQREFVDALYAGWGAQDTAAALESAEQLDDATTRDAALKAIRTVAPVGIGAAVMMQAGYPVITDLVPDAPADVSGLLHKGDRIIGIAQGDSAYVDARNLSLQEAVQMIRGAPGTTLQLQVLAADAAPDSSPRVVSVVRDQIKYKR